MCSVHGNLLLSAVSLHLRACKVDIVTVGLCDILRQVRVPYGERTWVWTSVGLLYVERQVSDTTKTTSLNGIVTVVQYYLFGGEGGTQFHKRSACSNRNHVSPNLS
ncbi:hypothetical protein TNCV_2132541 [Trichonephila clavipes]|nr:hypothetical protein TNCV_2132541 [Trichonephila clavipes]